jgi:mRNA-degrading endonuclease toxin of MazEF toxin-antitoxin module
MRQGEFWELNFGKVLVVSSDPHNDHPLNAPVVVPVVRGYGRPAGAAVALSEADPVSGVVLSTLVAAVERPQDGRALGMITGASMHRVMAEIGELFAY